MSGPRMYLLLVCALACVTSRAAAQTHDDQVASVPEQSTHVLQAAMMGRDVVHIDGRLNEPIWLESSSVRPFTQRLPHSGLPATQQTQVHVAYDDAALYVGIRLFDENPDSILARLARRDVPLSGSDWAHVYIDSYHDRRTAFRFSVNPRGVKLDAMHYDDTREDLNWDAVWEVAAQVDSLGWVAEYRIPLSQLRFNVDKGARGGMEWGVNFGRTIARNGEESFWAPIAAEDAGFVSRFGSLGGLVGFSAPRRVEITPYTVSHLTTTPGQGDDPFQGARTMGGTVGVDVQYGVTSDMTLNVSVNPDFGQVESDPSVVNLSAFETFLPEKRQFFLEGTDLFRVTYPDWPPVVYSRRIGAQPRGTIPDGAVNSDRPAATTILGATKLSGKTASGYSLGFMNAVTGAESARYIDADGLERSVRLEPTTSYSAARLVRDFRQGKSAIGLIATATNRKLVSGDPDWLHDAAYAVGFDARHRFAAGNYEIKGSVLGSHVRGSPSALARTQRAPGRYFQRPDAPHLEFDSLRTSLSGAQAAVSVGRVGGGHWRWKAAGAVTTPGFEINDLGFQYGSDRVTASGSVTFDETHASSLFRRWSLTLSQAMGWSTIGERKHAWTQLFGSGQFHNQWNIDVGFDRTHPAWSTEMLRGGPSIRTPGYVGSWFGLTGDPRGRVSVGWWSYGHLKDDGDGHQVFIEPNLTYRPSPNATLSVHPSLMMREEGAQYVSTVTGPRYIVGRLRQTTTALTARIDYTFSPTLSLEFYMQPFISRAAYSNFRQVDEPGAASASDRYAALDALVQEPRPDFNFKQLRSNLVVRWEYLPGSTVFLVWGQDRSDYETVGRIRPWRDVRRLFAADATHVFLLKVNYWLSR